jgi:hypothetical protein
MNAQTRLIVQDGAGERRDNLPVVFEFAAVIPDEYADHSYREIVLAERSNRGNVRRFSSIHPHHAAYLPLAYLLFFPHGGHGFTGDCGCRIAKTIMCHGRTKPYESWAYWRLWMEILS